MKTVLFLTLALLQAACSSSSKDLKIPEFDSHFNKLEVGMSKTEVKNLLGEPVLREARNTHETWHFEPKREVGFENGKVISFGVDSSEAPVSLPQTMPATTATTAAAASMITGLGIGETCTENKQCFGDNCHFHICSGRNNCQLKLGAVCATDENCCTGRCSLGTCTKH